jgi:hypothetical protein
MPATCVSMTGYRRARPERYPTLGNGNGGPQRRFGCRMADWAHHVEAPAVCKTAPAQKSMCLRGFERPVTVW